MAGQNYSSLVRYLQVNNIMSSGFGFGGGGGSNTIKYQIIVDDAQVNQKLNNFKNG